MSTHNIGFYEEISKIISYHQIHTLFLLLFLFFSKELVEAAMYLYRATKDPYLLEIGVDMMESIEHSTRTKCGYATVRK